MPIKRFAVFLGWNHCPFGGWNDLFGSFSSLDEARRATMGAPSAVRGERWDWCQVVDLATGAVVWRSK